MKFVISLPSGRGVVAFSGGVDSTALVLLLAELKADFVIAHLDHAMRSESAEDAIACKKFAQKIGRPFVSERLQQIPKNEDEARIARYDFLERVRIDQKAEWIALAHHRDDQAETFLLRALRGSGVRGLSAMKEWNGALWRPLLPYSKQWLITFVEQKNENWLTDSSNSNDLFLRNFLRNRIFPQLEEKIPEAMENFTKSAALCAEMTEFLDAEVQRFLASSEAISVKEFKDLHPVLQRAILETLLPRVRGNEIDEVLKMIAGGQGMVHRRVGEMTVSVEKGLLCFSKNSLASKEKSA